MLYVKTDGPLFWHNVYMSEHYYNNEYRAGQQSILTDAQIGMPKLERKNTCEK